MLSRRENKYISHKLILLRKRHNIWIELQPENSVYVFLSRGGNMTDSKKAKKMASGIGKKSLPSKDNGFSEEEKDAMRERAKEARRASGSGKKRSREEGEKEVLESISKMAEQDRNMAKRLHYLISENVPQLYPRTWYGMPAYAMDDRIMCFFQNSQKFKTRYSTLGFSDNAHLDDGSMWPTSFAVFALNKDTEEKIVELLKRAIA